MTGDLADASHGRAARPLRVLGLMSGTSVDAIDAAVIDIDADGTLRVVDHREFAWHPELRRRILAVLPPAATTVAEVCSLEQEIGQAFAEAAARVVDHVNHIDLIASHGQTVFHWVDEGVARGTLQWGEPAWIAEATGLPVVSNLRSADIAAGGQGAPLVSVLDARLFADRPTAVINLGGIANVTILHGGHPVVSGDTGPANCLLDAHITRATGGAHTFDRDGELSVGGRIDHELLERLRRHPYLSRPLPKSTGREVFSLDWLDGQLEGWRGSDADVWATLVEFTASTLLDHLRAPAGQDWAVERLVVSGGGAHHPGIMARLREHHEVVGPEVAGVPGDAKEAVLIALLGWLSVNGLPGVAVDTEDRPLTGADQARVLGTITLAHGGVDLLGGTLSGHR